MSSPQNNIIQSNDPEIKKYLLATRPMFLTASALPVLLGSAIGFHTSAQFDAIAFVLALFSVILAHAAINVLNDVYDDLSGTDRFNDERIFPFTGGSRFIQDDILNLNQMRRWGYLLLVMSVVLGLALVAHKGLMVLVFGIVGVFLGVAYSAPPLKLASRGIGESAVGIGFGVIPVVGAAWLQTGYFSWEALLLSVPVSIWVANILLINEVPDRAADGKAGKNTLVVKFGLKSAATIYLILSAVALSALVWAAVLNYIPALALILSFLLFIPAIVAARAIINWKIKPGMMEAAIKMTLTIHAANILWLLGWYIAG
ncbi:MAG: prenyltransferase [Gammaproteobacteria bacterium]|jgi:1,4-dihydroxy-2-naphthoate polyprenyltransferase